MRHRLPANFIGVALLLQAALPWGHGGQPAPVPAPAGLVVLDTAGFWRLHHTLQAPELQAEDGLKPFPYYEGKLSWQKSQIVMWQGLLAEATAAPAADWRTPEFDDSSWFRGTAARACRTPYLSRLCLRGKFTVADPAKVEGLRLFLSYHGGAVVYMNGREIGRQHFPTGAALADAYPEEAFVDGDGKLITLRGDEALWPEKPAADVAKRIASRDRQLAATIPATALRPGVNVLAIELVRAPYHRVLEERMPMSNNHGPHKVFEASWNTCQLRQVQLTAASAAGLVPEAVRPAGFQVWNSDPLATDYDLDFGSPSETLRPIELVGARNGVYSGKVVVGCDRPVRGLLAAAGDLKGPGGVIPATNVRIRFAMPWGDIALVHLDNSEVLPYPAKPTPLLALCDAPPATVAVYEKETTDRCLKLPGQPRPVFGAVAPVWVTVKVPKDARPGSYAGQVAITAEGLPPVRAAIAMNVLDWTLPDPAQAKTWVEMIEAPDTLAMEYGVPLWSPRHWEMIAQAMAFQGNIGNRVVYIPLIAQSNLGNEQTMVRWIKKDGGTYAYDFSLMDKYLDLAEKHMGRPEVVVFMVWDRYLIRKESGGRDFQVASGLKIAAKGPMVTAIDPSSGQTETVVLPDYADRASVPLWKPLFDRLREKLAKRGLEKAMHLGLCSDFWGTREQIAVLAEVTGNLPWANAGHYVQKSLHNGLASFGYQSSYFGVRFGHDKSLHGWGGPDLHVLFEREALDRYPLSKWRFLPEQSITGNARGVGRLGADTWWVVRDEKGDRRGRAWERFPSANWGYLNADSSLLAPGPDGPVATARFEALREGRQECEALIVVERALMDKDLSERLGAALVERCENVLQQRRAALWRSLGIWQAGLKYSHELTSWRSCPVDTGYVWFLGSGWQERSARLFALAADVEKKLGGLPDEAK